MKLFGEKYKVTILKSTLDVLQTYGKALKRANKYITESLEKIATRIGSGKVNFFINPLDTQQEPAPTTTTTSTL